PTELSRTRRSSARATNAPRCRGHSVSPATAVTSDSRAGCAAVATRQSPCPRWASAAPRSCVCRSRPRAAGPARSRRRWRAPPRHPVRRFTLAGARRFQKGGVSLASRVGESEEFVSLRDYRPGDPLRLIHWKSWARRGRPVVKEFQDEFFVRYGLVLDTFATG